jgi:hypothetical protein
MASRRVEGQSSLETDGGTGVADADQLSSLASSSHFFVTDEIDTAVRVFRTED